MYPSIELFHLSIPTFFAVICFGFIVSLVFIYLRLDLWLKIHYWIPNEFRPRVWIIAGICMGCALIGARATHVFYELPSYYRDNPKEIFYFWNGGFVFYGGFILSILISWLYLWFIAEKNIGLYFDFFAPIMSVGYLVGRLGCLLNGCCYGKVCALPWAIKFNDEQGQYLLRHPTQLYSMLFEAGLLCFVLAYEKRDRFYFYDEKSIREKKLGMLFLWWLLGHACFRLITEQVRDDFRGPEYGLSFSSWVSVVLMGTALIMLVKKRA